MSADWHGWPAIAASLVGLAFAFVGALFTLDKDPIDNLPFAVAPLKYSEEALSLVAFGYCLYDFAKTVSEEA